MSPDPAAGTEVAGYRIVEQAGSGGMGVVYRAEETGLGGRPVALKLLPAALAGDPDFRARFLREMRVAAAIDHPNIVPIYRAGEDRGRLYLAMRYVHASDLRRVLEAEGRLDPGRALAILDQVARALDAAHARGLVHRDVKPGNILLAPPVFDGDPEHVYLVDFGLARSDSDDRSLGGAGSFLGTPRYAAPEQAAGRPVDGRTDGYALGCVLYECLTGQPPVPRRFGRGRPPRPPGSPSTPGHHPPPRPAPRHRPGRRPRHGQGPGRPVPHLPRPAHRRPPGPRPTPASRPDTPHPPSAAGPRPRPRRRPHPPSGAPEPPRPVPPPRTRARLSTPSAPGRRFSAPHHPNPAALSTAPRRRPRGVPAAAATRAAGPARPVGVDPARPGQRGRQPGRHRAARSWPAAAPATSTCGSARSRRPGSWSRPGCGWPGSGAPT